MASPIGSDNRAAMRSSISWRPVAPTAAVRRPSVEGAGRMIFQKVQEVFGTLQQLGREHALRRLHSKMIFKAGSRLLIEWLITKVGPDALLLGAFRGGAVG